MRYGDGHLVAVGTALTGSPPHRSVRAELPHTAPTSGEWRKSDLAALRTFCFQNDALSRPCVRHAAVCRSFPLVSPLSSTASATGIPPALFGCFPGTMGLSDCPETFMSGFRHSAFPDRPILSSLMGVSGLSRFPRKEFPRMLRVSDCAVLHKTRV